MVVTGSGYPSVIRNMYFELAHTVLRPDNGKSHACQWKLSRTTQVVLIGLKAQRLCPQCRTSVVLL
jgi:hypothetical protein